MPETLTTKFDRFKFNLFPAYRGTGARIVSISSDYRHIRIKLPLNWRTRNYVGTIFGGSLYGAVDPIYMIMLIKNLGNDYVVWDKTAAIKFRKPGKETLFADFRIDQKEVDEIEAILRDRSSVDRIYTIELKDAAGNICCVVEKSIYIARK
jgi:acyl-coenzyme A thioesterase PaaI-like protein